MRRYAFQLIAGFLYLAAAMANDKTTLALHTITQANGRIAQDASPVNFSMTAERLTFAQETLLRSRPHIVGVDCNTGRIRVFELNETGLGKTVSEYKHVNFRCSSAAMVPSALGPYLFLLDSFRGRIQRIRVLPTGELDFATDLAFQNAVWRDKNIFTAFTQSGQARLYGMNTWTGEVVVTDFNAVVLGQDTFTPGYTAVDHIELGSNTYRVLYKAAGHPYESETDESPGLLVVQRLSSNGLNLANAYSGKTDAGFSHVRFLPEALDNGVLQTGLLFYNRQTGAYRVRSLSPAGVPSFIVFASGELAPGWTDFQPYSAYHSNRLLAINDDNVAPFYYDQAKQFGQEIHAELSNKAIGYQLMVSQSGRIVFSRAWGQSKLDANPAQDIPMTIRTPHDMGSVGKMITTMTTLKLADDNVRGLGVGDPLHTRLAQAPPEGSWVFSRGIWNLLTHTTGMRDQDDNDDACVNAPGYRKDCTPFFSAEPTDGFNRVYNNSNVAALRKVIEWATYTETSPEITEETYKAWASSLHLDASTTGNGANGNALSCRLPANVNYFGRCFDGQNCFLRNGHYWQQSKFGEPDQEWSYTCSAGGWMASSRQMIEFLLGVRYQKVLSENMNNLLLSTNLQDASQRSTAVGWEPPWDAGDGLGKVNLAKDGSLSGHGVATRAYITRLPGNADAVLMVNSAAPSPVSLLRGTYQRAAGFSNATVNYSDIIALSRRATALSGVDNLSAGTLAFGQATYQPANANYVVAMRGAGNLRLAGFHVTTEGAVEERGNQVLAGAVKDVAITDGNAFATAVVTNANLLRVDAWTIDGNIPDTIHRQGSANGVPATRAVIAKVAGTGTAAGRVVTAVRRNDAALRLDSWDCNNLADTVINRGSATAGTVRTVALTTLQYQNSLDDATRVVTAVHNGQNRLQLDSWEIAANGQITRNPGTLTTGFELGGTARPVSLRRISNTRFFAAYVDESGNLGAAIFAVAANGAVSLEGSLVTEGQTTMVANAASLTATRLDDGSLVLRQWKLTPGAEIGQLAMQTLGAINELAATGRSFVVYTTGAGNDLVARSFDFVD